MNESSEKIRVQRAVDTRLYALQGDPYLAQRILRNIQREDKVQKKGSVAFVLIMALLLVTITALAAITLSDFYEKATQKEIESGLIEEWSTQDKLALISWMIEANIAVDEAQLKDLNDDTINDSMRDTLAMAIIDEAFPFRYGALNVISILSNEKGPYEFWSLEDKAWYTSIQQKYVAQEEWCLYDQNTLPDADDMSMEEALMHARTYLTGEVGLTDQEIDETLAVTSSFRYTSYCDQPCWTFGYYFPRDQLIRYWVSVAPDGSLFATDRFDLTPEDGTALSDAFSDLVQANDGAFYSTEGFATFAQSDLAKNICEAVHQGVLEKSTQAAFFASIPYAFPDSSAISEEQANQTALQALCDYIGCTEKEMTATYIRSTSYRIYDEKPQWRVGFRLPINQPIAQESEHVELSTLPFCIIIQIDPFSGKVQKLWEEQQNQINQWGE